MNKKITTLPLLIFLISACTTSSNVTFDENSAPASMEKSNQAETMERINDIKNGATPNVKPTGEDSAPKPPVPPIQTEKTESNNNQVINEDTKNMNTAVIKTNKGTIKVKLNPEKAPVTVENFKNYVKEGFYAGTIFHRVIPGFMIQGGGFEASTKQKETKAPIKIESDNGLKNDRGTIAMARTMVPDSATSQFFINLVDNDMLNYRSPDMNGYGYAVFGTVTEGLDVVDEIAKVKTGAQGPHQDWPEEDVVIESVNLEE